MVDEERYKPLRDVPAFCIHSCKHLRFRVKEMRVISVKEPVPRTELLSQSNTDFNVAMSPGEDRNSFKVNYLLNLLAGDLTMKRCLMRFVASIQTARRSISSMPGLTLQQSETKQSEAGTRTSSTTRTDSSSSETLTTSTQSEMRIKNYFDYVKILSKQKIRKISSLKLNLEAGLDCSKIFYKLHSILL